MIARIVLILCAAALAACQTTGSSTGSTQTVAGVAASAPDPHVETTIIDGKTFRIALPDDQCIVREQQSSEPVQKLRNTVHEVSERSDVAVLGIFAPCRLLDRWSAGDPVGKPNFGHVIAARTDGRLVDLGPAITEQVVFDDIEQRLRDGRMNRAIGRGRKAAREMEDLFLRDPQQVNPAYRPGYRLARRDASALYLRQPTAVEIGGEVVHGSDWLAITIAGGALVHLGYATTADQQDDARTLQVLRTVVASLRGEPVSVDKPAFAGMPRVDLPPLPAPPAQRPPTRDAGAVALPRLPMPPGFCIVDRETAPEKVRRYAGNIDGHAGSDVIVIDLFMACAWLNGTDAYRVGTPSPLGFLLAQARDSRPQLFAETEVPALMADIAAIIRIRSGRLGGGVTGGLMRMMAAGEADESHLRRDWTLVDADDRTVRAVLRMGPPGAPPEKTLVSAMRFAVVDGVLVVAGTAARESDDSVAAAMARVDTILDPR